jgi:hypothetical protein
MNPCLREGGGTLLPLPAIFSKKPLVQTRGLAAQSRQSAKLFLKSRNWDSPNPSPAGECAPSPPPVFGGGEHSLAREGWGESQFRRGYIHCGTLYIYVLCGKPYRRVTLLSMLHRWKFVVVGGVIRLSASKATLLILLLEEYFFTSTLYGSVQYITKIVRYRCGHGNFQNWNRNILHNTVFILTLF